VSVSVDRVTSWLTRLVQIPSIGPENAGPRSGPSTEAALAAQLASWFAAFGATVEQEEVFPGRPNVVAVWHNPTSDRWLAVDAHTDTVGVETMEGDPFDGRLADGRVYGRGAVDTKATFAVLLALLENLHQSGQRLPHNLLISAPVAEETGIWGAPVFARWMQQQPYKLDELIIAEPTLCTPVHGHRGSAGIILEVEGVAAHSAQPHLGRNAIVAAASVIQALDAHHQDLVARPPTPLGTGTATVTLINGGQAHNIVPDRCRLNVDRRLTLGEDADHTIQVIHQIAQAAAPFPVHMTVKHRLAPFYDSPASHLVQQLAAWSGRSPQVVGYGTDASHYTGLARESAIFGPGSIDQAHRDVEWVSVAELERALRIYEQWLGIPGS
jgi:acetylornithine deacetylase/succinyl-diaminopimelate desuccinylase-like protein